MSHIYKPEETERLAEIKSLRAAFVRETKRIRDRARLRWRRANPSETEEMR